MHTVRRDVDCFYQKEIEGPPMSVKSLHEIACSGDGITVDTWRPTWIKNYAAAKDRFGTFEGKTIGSLYGLNRHKAAIVVGSGPSLKYSLDALRQNQNAQNPLLVVSCLHNFGYFQDEGIRADYWLSLDSGGVVIDDVSESRNKDGGFYWSQTKDQKLIAYVASDPRLFDLWEGETFLFNCQIPDRSMNEEINKIERLSHYLSCGGNALGACMYLAKVVMGSSTIMYVGADFCFDYTDGRFHSYKTNYDNPGRYVTHTDVFGNQRKTWPSYLNFKYWFDWVACTVPGFWFNCSEGLLGAYLEGNIRQFKYMPLKDALIPYELADRCYLEKYDVVDGKQSMVSKDEFRLDELYKNSKYDKDLILF